MTTDTSLLARDSLTVKLALLDTFSEIVDDLLDAAEAPGATERGLELEVWTRMLPLIRMLLSVMWSLLCRRATEADLEKRGLTLEQVRLRLDDE